MPQDNKAYAKREKAYMQGKLFPYIKVGMTKVNLTPTVIKDKNGVPHTEQNAPVYIYDTSGPFSDPNIEVDLKKGLPHVVTPRPPGLSAGEMLLGNIFVDAQTVSI